MEQLLCRYSVLLVHHKLYVLKYPQALPVQIGMYVFVWQVLVTEDERIMVDHREDGAPMPLAHYGIQNDSRLTLRVVVSKGAVWVAAAWRFSVR
jgi:hypothetical protein